MGRPLWPAHSFGSEKIMVRDLWLGLVAATLLVGCGTTPPVGQPTALVQPAPGYPEPGNPTPDGYPGQSVAITPAGQTPVPPLDAPVAAPETAPGTASISGLAYARSGAVVADTTFFLTPGQGADQMYPPDYVPDPDQARGDIIGKTDATGRFEAANVPPGRYFLFFWGQYGWREGEVSIEDQAPLAIQLQPDARLPLGVVPVSWP